ncbi:hypothetical protein MXB_836, partial [Myxobolus squamalis]
MTLSRTGVLYDYFGGLNDLAERKVRFVHDPNSRIKEDYLRILRFFRFYGRVADQPARIDSFDENVIKLIYQFSPNLKNIPAERIWNEISQILLCSFAPSIVEIIYDLKIFNYCRLLSFKRLNTKRFSLYHNNCMRRPKNSDVPDIKACALLSSFFESLEDAELSCTNLKLSRSNRITCLFLIKNRSKDTDIKNINPLIDYYKSILILNSEVASYHSVLSDTIQLMLCEGSANEHIISIKKWVIPHFTLKITHLKNHCIGPEICNVLILLKQKWIES